MEWTQHPEIMSHPVILTNAHIHAVQISEHLFGMLFMLARRLHSAYRQQLEKVWQRDTLLSDLEIIAGKTLCVVGLGSIGRRCAMLGKAHEMRVIGIRNRPQSTPYGKCRMSSSHRTSQVGFLATKKAPLISSWITSVDTSRMNHYSLW